MSELNLKCSSCQESSALPTSYSVTQRGKSYDINRRAVYHAVESGSGYEGLAAFCSIMNMPCLSKPAYYKQVDNILEALEDEARDIVLIDIVLLANRRGVNGSKMKRQELQHMMIVTVCLRSFLKS